MLTGAFGQLTWTRLKRTRKNNLMSSIHSLNGHLWSLFQARFIYIIEYHIMIIFKRVDNMSADRV